MSQLFACPSTGRPVELTDEREAHIVARHPELAGILRQCIAATLADPDSIRQGGRSKVSRTFARWFDAILDGKHVVVVVVTDSDPIRDWVVTAYVARKLGGGAMIWKRD